MTERAKNPAIPGTPKDRTGTAGIVRRALAAIRGRFAGLEAEILAIFGRIRVYEKNDTRDFGSVIYALSPDELAQVSADLQAALDRWIAVGRESRSVLWWDAFQAEAQQLGTAQAVSNLANLAGVYAATRTLESVVFSEPYAARAATARFKSYEHWSGLSQALRTELSQIIGAAVIDGKNPVAVRKQIAERLGVSLAKAAQYAQTDITDTLRQSRMAEYDFATESMGLKLGLLWTSALKVFTRPWHAARSGRVYTAQEVRQFYSVNGNRYNCFCSITECLLDEGGKPLLSDALKSSMKSAREAWQKRNV